MESLNIRLKDFLKKSFLIDDHNKRNFYASTKILIENYLKNLKSIKNKLVITRLFNLYEFNDAFSLISKVVDCKKNRKTFVACY